eukprot:TRINITY_DN486_c0_g1_i4.p1 TRINITY_DN486_c0_g1~~TRINITY_DN486_c0_g1_i4.p1  ORF type:complete len:690 (+),score=83.78 TRINITY_DN486_c0_g1_i4:60-2129(+)
MLLIWVVMSLAGPYSPTPSGCSGNAECRIGWACMWLRFDDNPVCTDTKLCENYLCAADETCGIMRNNYSVNVVGCVKRRDPCLRMSCGVGEKCLVPFNDTSSPPSCATVDFNPCRTWDCSSGNNVCKLTKDNFPFCAPSDPCSTTYCGANRYCDLDASFASQCLEEPCVNTTCPAGEHCINMWNDDTERVGLCFGDTEAPPTDAPATPAPPVTPCYGITCEVGTRCEVDVASGSPSCIDMPLCPNITCGVNETCGLVVVGKEQLCVPKKDPCVGKCEAYGYLAPEVCVGGDFRVRFANYYSCLDASTVGWDCTIGGASQQVCSAFGMRCRLDGWWNAYCTDPDPCTSVRCGSDEYCDFDEFYNAVCLKQPCLNTTCPAGTHCVNGWDELVLVWQATCVNGTTEAPSTPEPRSTDAPTMSPRLAPCVNHTCALGSRCEIDAGGSPVCFDTEPCSNMTCRVNETCGIDRSGNGLCVTKNDACYDGIAGKGQCAQGEFCISQSTSSGEPHYCDSDLFNDPCKDVVCPSDMRCRAEGLGNPLCAVPDPCWNLRSNSSTCSYSTNICYLDSSYDAVCDWNPCTSSSGSICPWGSLCKVNPLVTTTVWTWNPAASFHVRGTRHVPSTEATKPNASRKETLASLTCAKRDLICNTCPVSDSTRTPSPVLFAGWNTLKQCLPCDLIILSSMIDSPGE